MKVVEDVESRPHRAVPFVVEREKEMQEWNEQKLPKVLPGFCGGRLPGRSSVEKGREEGEPDDGREERKFWSEIAQEVVASIKEERECARRCQVDRTKNSWARVKQKLGLLTNRTRRIGGRERLARGGPDGSAMGGR